MIVEYLGTARGCGWQKIGALVNLGTYYIVGIPSAILLAFVLHIGRKVNIHRLLFCSESYVEHFFIFLKLYESWVCDLQGLWLGIICDLFVQVLLLTITLCTDWEKEANPFVNSSAANDVTFGLF